jgi:hypothetical protein
MPRVDHRKRALHRARPREAPEHRQHRERCRTRQHAAVERLAPPEVRKVLTGRRWRAVTDGERAVVSRRSQYPIGDGGGNRVLWHRVVDPRLRDGHVVLNEVVVPSSQDRGGTDEQAGCRDRHHQET